MQHQTTGKENGTMNITPYETKEKTGKRLLLAAGLVLAAGACAYAANDVAGLELAGDAMDQVGNTSKKGFSLIVMITSWIAAVIAFALVYNLHGKLKTKMEQQQDDSGSAFMLWVKVAGAGFIALIMVGLIIYLVWGKIVPIKGSNADYGTVVKAALTGDLDEVSGSEVSNTGNN